MTASLPDTPFELRLLGAPSLLRSGEGVAEPVMVQPRRLALLAFLALGRPRGLHTRDALLARLWPDVDQVDGRRALRNALYGLRQVLGPQAIVTVGDTLVALDPNRVSCDAHALEAAVAGGDLARMEAVADHALMEGFHVNGAPEFERWLDAERARLRETLGRGCRTAEQDCRMRGDREGALRAARVATRIDPLDEDAARRLVEAHLALGDRRGALQAYRAFEQQLREELDETPSAEFRAFGATLPSREPAGAAAQHGPEMLCVRGNYLFLRAAHGGNPDDLARCRAIFEQALALDPTCGPALAGLSNYFAAAAARDLLRPFETHFAHAIALAEQALACDETLAIPHVHFGVQAMYLADDWGRAGDHFARAVALDPLYAEGHRFLGVYHAAMGRTEDALRHLREGVRTEPMLAIFRNSLADLLMAQGSYDEAITELRAALDADVRYAAARERLVRCFERSGRYPEAVAERRFLGAAGRADEFQAALESEGAAGYRRVREAELRALVDRLEGGLGATAPSHPGDRFNPPELRLALACAELGDTEGARRWEEHACGTRPGRRRWFASRPELRPQGPR